MSLRGGNLAFRVYRLLMSICEFDPENRKEGGKKTRKRRLPRTAPMEWIPIDFMFFSVCER